MARCLQRQRLVVDEAASPCEAAHIFESQLVEFDGEDDYVHLLVNYPPKIAVAVIRQYIEHQRTPH